MDLKNTDFVKGYVIALSDVNYSYSQIKKQLKIRNIDISKFTISKIIQKQRNSLTLGHNMNIPVPKRYKKSTRTKEAIHKVELLVRKENPETQRTIASRLNMSVGSVNNIIHKDLDLKTRKIYKTHRLLPKHRQDRFTKCRLLYENYLAGDKWKFVVTIDEAWVYLQSCNRKRSIYYEKRGERNREQWIVECKESYPKGIMVVAGFSYKGKLAIRKVPPNVKINSQFYQREVLDPIFHHDIPSFYGEDLGNVFLHQDKASSHTSRSTTAYLDNLCTETGINVIPFKSIPTKSPDAAPMDFCCFGLLKYGLSKRHPTTITGLWKVVEEEWSKLNQSVLIKSLLSWKVRCRAIVLNQGYQIEHMKARKYGV